MKIKLLDGQFAVCKIEDLSRVNFESKYLFVAKTDDEISLVCELESVPENAVSCEKGWRAFKIDEILDFSLTGIMAGIASTLAAENISVFVVSTYNTDYIFVKSDATDKAAAALRKSGYDVV